MNWTVVNSIIYTRRSFCFVPSIAKILSLTENLRPIEARQFFKIQVQDLPQPTRKARAQLTTLINNILINGEQIQALGSTEVKKSTSTKKFTHEAASEYGCQKLILLVGFPL